MARSIRLILAMAMLAIAASCGSGSSGSAAPTAPPGGTVLHFGEHAVSAEIAANNEDRATGLMHRPKLAADAGMLFIFPSPTDSGFYMKNTLIPLSIAFLDRPSPLIFEVVAVLDMEPCRAEPCTVYNPGVSYDAALEVNKGWFAQAGIQRGDTATIAEGLPTPK